MRSGDEREKEREKKAKMRNDENNTEQKALPSYFYGVMVNITKRESDFTLRISIRTQFFCDMN